MRWLGVMLLAVSTLQAPTTGHGSAAFVGALEELRQAQRIPGLSYAVLRHGELLAAGGLGVADITTGRLATADTVYNIASVTKPISAVLIMQLVEQGHVDLDRPIAEYSAWREFCTAFAAQPSIFARHLQCDPPLHTLRQLLSHTATGTPGADFSYNPVLYSWASRPVAAVMGEAFSDLVQSRVLSPAKMARAVRIHRARPVPAALAPDVAPPHRVDEEGKVVPSPPLDGQGDGAAGGVLASVLDLVAFDRALEAGTLIDDSSRRQMLARQSDAVSGKALPYGIGWYRQRYAGRELVWHAGWWEEAYSALYLKLPEEGLTLILLANSEGIWWGNPLDEAAVQESLFASAFLRHYPQR